MVLSVRGEIDLATAPQLRRSIHDLIDGGHRQVAVDLTDVEFMDSTGLGVLIGSLKRLNEDGGNLVLTGLRPAVSRVFEITGLDRIFTVHDSVANLGGPDLGTRGR